MKDKIIITIAYLISKKTITYSIIILSVLGMIIYSISNYYIEKGRKITFLNIEKTNLINKQKEKLKPIQEEETKIKKSIDKIKLDLQNETNLLTQNQDKQQPIITCINHIRDTLDSTDPTPSCEPNNIIQKASASEEVIKEQPKKLLTPNELFYTTKKSDGCHISQNEQGHFTKAGGYMLATDVACDFDKNGKADQAEVYAPDYLNKEYEYLVYKKHDDLLGDYIELISGDIKWIIGHTTTKLKDGDIVQTGQRIGQNNLTGYTTGYHSHIELWSLIDGKWKNISYTTRSETLNNKRNNILSKWKEGDKFYFTSYHIGDVNQNDSSPYIGASGKDLRNITNPIALTIDVRKSLGIKWGDKVKLTGPCAGIYQVEDEMNQRFRYSNIMKDNYPIKGDIAIPLGTEAKCSGVYSITKI